VTDRIDVAPLGFVSSADLGPVFARWELSIAPLSGGASDGRSSLRIPLSHGIPTLTELGRPEDLTLRPSHLGLVGDDPETAIAGAVAVAADRDARRRGASEVDDFERRVRGALQLALLGPDASPTQASTLAPRAVE
jgi:hypothetical protein